MNTVTNTPVSTITPLPKADIERLARYQYSLDVQGSRLDMQAYDMDKSLRKARYRSAKRMVRGLEARGIQVTVED